MSSYGTRAERAAMKELQTYGYAYVLRSAGSHGAADIVAFHVEGNKPPHVMVIQVKATRNPEYVMRIATQAVRELRNGFGLESRPWPGFSFEAWVYCRGDWLVFDARTFGT